MLEFSLLDLTTAALLGVLIGYTMSRYITVHYCPNCEHYAPTWVEYCPECGLETEEREIKRLHDSFTRISEFISNHTDWEFIKQPRLQDYKHNGAGEVGTYYLYPANVDEEHVDGLTENGYGLILEDVGVIDFGLDEVEEDAHGHEQRPLRGTVKPTATQFFLKKEGENE